MLKRTHGIVLKNAVFGEADLIVTYLTPHYGLLKAFAKSPRKIRSRFGSSLEPLTYANISFFGKEDAGLPRLTQSDIIRPFHSLRCDFNCLLDISEILELCLNFLPEREPAPDIFKLLLNMMTTLESHADGATKLFYLFYKMRFLQAAGYLPGLSACGKCGTKTSSWAFENSKAERHYFYVEQGAVMCSRCITGGGGSMPLSRGSLKFYESLLKWDPSAIGRVNAPAHLVEELRDIIDEHIKYALGPSRFAHKKGR